MTKHIDARGTDIYSVKCPKCGAEPSRPCVSSPSGAHNSFPHVARFDLAGKQGKENGDIMIGIENVKDPPELKALVDASRARYDALSPIEKAIYDMEQRRSGIIGMAKLSAPREQIEARIDAMPEYIVLAELKRLRAIQPPNVRREPCVTSAGLAQRFGFQR